MQDQPTPVEILGSVIAFLRDEVMPGLKGATAFQTRVAANALDLVRRELMIPAQEAQQENGALQSLVGESGTTESLTAQLARRIADGSIDPAAPEVEAFLWATTEAKLAVDQPGYAGLKRARALRAAKEQES